uniref:Putative structural protein n=1 Tax=viral metagenome TaxID=1070528 RepID=A0A6M3J2A1_9ZZZZ
MPDMSSIDARFGAQPWGNVLRQRLYAIATAPTLAFYIGDVVGHDGTALSTPHGTIAALEKDATTAGGGAGKQVGAVTALFDEKMDPTPYIAASATGNGTIAGYAMVADHPDQEFLIQEDGDTSSVVVANIGLNADYIATTAGSTTTGLSGHELDSNTVNTTATLDLKILDIHPEDSISAAGAAGNHARFIVRINAHYHGANVAGI